MRMGQGEDRRARVSSRQHLAIGCGAFDGDAVRGRVVEIRAAVTDWLIFLNFEYESVDRGCDYAACYMGH